MEMQAIKKLTTKELQENEEQLRAQLFALRIQKALGKLEAPHTINQLRKDIARIKTELTTRKNNGETIRPLNITSMTLEEDKKETKVKEVKAKTVKKTVETKEKVAKPKTVKKTSTSTKTTTTKEDNK